MLEVEMIIFTPCIKDNFYKIKSNKRRKKMNDLVPMEIQGKASSRKLQFFWLLDVSGSMAGKKIEVLNRALKEVIPTLEEIEENERIEFMMRVIAFNDEAWWHIGPKPVGLNDFFDNWEDLEAGSTTNTAEAINLMAEELDIEKMGKRNVPPVAILISDGYCTSDDGEYEKAIENLNKLPWGKKAVRLSIGITDGKYSYNKEELDMFISPYLKSENEDEGVETLHADNPRALAKYIKTASTTASVSASRSNTDKDDNSSKPADLNKAALEEESIIDVDIDDASEVF
jgi:uncharacterized protein YegL